MLSNREYRQRIAFKKTIEDALSIDAVPTMRGIFEEMRYNNVQPEFLSVIAYTPGMLDDLFLNYASEKWLSKMGCVLYDVNTSGELVHTGYIGTIVEMLYALYLDKWDRIWDAFVMSDYNPLDNYNMYQKAKYNSSEAHTGTDTLTKSGTETDTKSGTETNTKSGTETNTKSGTETKTQGGSETNVKSGSEQLAKAGSEATVYNSNTENNVSAFNSSEYQDATKAIHSGSDGISYGKTAENSADPRTDTTTYQNVTDTKTFTNRTDALSFNQRNDELSFNNRRDELSFSNRQDTLSFSNREDQTAYNSTMAHNGFDELERRGNIGVTTSQQMLQSELDLRQYNFLLGVFQDITDFLGLPIY